MKYFEKIGEPVNKNVLNLVITKVPISPNKKGKFFKCVSKKIQNITK
jgi:hypothetical protein